MSNKISLLKKVSSRTKGFTDYEFENYGEPFFNENDVKVHPVRKFKITNGEIADRNEMNQIIDDITYHYDNWEKKELNKILRNAGIEMCVRLTIIRLVTGLSLGLKKRWERWRKKCSNKMEKTYTSRKKKTNYTMGKNLRSKWKRNSRNWKLFSHNCCRIGNIYYCQINAKRCN